MPKTWHQFSELDPAQIHRAMQTHRFGCLISPCLLIPIAFQRSYTREVGRKPRQRSIKPRRVEMAGSPDSTGMGPGATNAAGAARMFAAQSAPGRDRRELRRCDRVEGPRWHDPVLERRRDRDVRLLSRRGTRQEHRTRHPDGAARRRVADPREHHGRRTHSPH